MFIARWFDTVLLICQLFYSYFNLFEVLDNTKSLFSAINCINLLPELVLFFYTPAIDLIHSRAALTLA